MIRSRTTRVIIAAVSIASATLVASQAIAAAVKNADDPARREKAVLYLQRAEELLGNEKPVPHAGEHPSSVIDQTAAGHARQSVATAQAALGDIIGAKKTAELIPDWKIKISILTQIAEMEAKIDSPAAAKKTLAAAKAALAAARQAKSPTAIDEWQWDGLIGRAQARIGDIPGAEATAKELEKPSDKAFVWTAIGSAKAQASDQTAAKTAFAKARDAIKDERSPMVDLDAIARAEWAASEQAPARETFNHYTSASGADYDTLARAGTWAGIARTDATTKPAFAKAAANEARRALLTIIPDQSTAQMREYASVTRPYLLAHVSRTLARTGDLAAARELLAEALKGIDGLGEKIVAPLLEIALAQREAGEERAYQATLKQVFDKTGKLLDDLARTTMWSTMATKLAEAGDLTAAAEAVARWAEDPIPAVKLRRDREIGAMPEGDEKELAKAQLGMKKFMAPAIAIALAQFGGAKADMTWIEKLPPSPWKAWAYAAAAQGMLADK